LLIIISDLITNLLICCVPQFLWCLEVFLVSSSWSLFFLVIFTISRCSLSKWNSVYCLALIRLSMSINLSIDGIFTGEDLFSKLIFVCFIFSNENIHKFIQVSFIPVRLDGKLLVFLQFICHYIPVLLLYVIQIIENHGYFNH
jgi:hypothetical protein